MFQIPVIEARKVFHFPVKGVSDPGTLVSQIPVVGVSFPGTPWPSLDASYPQAITLLTSTDLKLQSSLSGFREFRAIGFDVRGWLLPSNQGSKVARRPAISLARLRA